VTIEYKGQPKMEYKSTIDVSVIQAVGSDEMIAAAAWVSTSAGAGLSRAADNPQDVPGVINYLMKNRHGTPFEHGSITFYVHAPIFVWREWHRHRIGFSFNEESARYKTLEPVFYIPPKDRPMMKVEGWKPGKPKFLTVDDYVKQKFGYLETEPDSETMDQIREEANTIYAELIFNLTRGYKTGYQMYLDNLKLNIDPGLARDCLPVGIYSSCWVTCNPRSLMAFLSLRVNDETATFPSYPLWEIEQAAKKCEEYFKNQWPLTYQAFIKKGRVGP
jgi:thymidylate synthase (FAD)